MGNEMKYEFRDDYITIRESGDCIYLHEYNYASELDFRIEDSDKVITLLENLKNCMELHDFDYVDLGTHEGEDEDGDPTGDYYWNDDYVMNNKKINPYFSPNDFFYGNCIYRDYIPYILEALSEYLNPSSLDKLEKLTLKSILRLKRDLAK